MILPLELSVVKLRHKSGHETYQATLDVFVALEMICGIVSLHPFFIVMDGCLHCSAQTFYALGRVQLVNNVATMILF